MWSPIFLSATQTKSNRQMLFPINNYINWYNNFKTKTNILYIQYTITSLSKKNNHPLYYNECKVIYSKILWLSRSCCIVWMLACFELLCFLHTQIVVVSVNWWVRDKRFTRILANNVDYCYIDVLAVDGYMSDVTSDDPNPPTNLVKGLPNRQSSGSSRTLWSCFKTNVFSLI